MTLSMTLSEPSVPSEPIDFELPADEALRCPCSSPGGLDSGLFCGRLLHFLLRSWTQQQKKTGNSLPEQAAVEASQMDVNAVII
ncbi:hypothetical protein chiPu_0018530 [Chiloscyllium punctatum]|uniref:Uncharacterized protein n=1 Tax=Chiloscyllium punctatum TaxID=137246 RepID=A0A401RNX4_CHIPU|nr:hypothetical protein [Chiloscyllium punctatum]